MKKPTFFFAASRIISSQSFLIYYTKPENLNKKNYKDYIGLLLIRTFADYKRKTGIGPLLANKDRGTSIKKTIMDYGQTDCQELLTT